MTSLQFRCLDHKDGEGDTGDLYPTLRITTVKLAVQTPVNKDGGKAKETDQLCLAIHL